MFKIKTIFLISVSFLFFGNLVAQNTTYPVAPFEKVTVSPHIQVRFIKGDKEIVEIENSEISIDKLNVEVSGSTLRIYLDDAKMVTKSKKDKEEPYKGKQSIYKGTIIKAVVYYKTLTELSLRGEQKFVCESKLATDKFVLDIYGESHVLFNDVKFNSLTSTIYGESVLEIKSGIITRHKIISYGESEVKTLNVATKTAKITAYGEGEIHIQVSNELKVTSYGEAEITYKGNPIVKKGIVIGDAEIKRIN